MLVGNSAVVTSAGSVFHQFHIACNLMWDPALHVTAELLGRDGTGPVPGRVELCFASCIVRDGRKHYLFCTELNTRVSAVARHYDDLKPLQFFLQLTLACRVCGCHPSTHSPTSSHMDCWNKYEGRKIYFIQTQFFQIWVGIKSSVQQPAPFGLALIHGGESL